MKRSVFAVSILILTLLASFFWAGGTQQAMADTITLANEAGISAYVNVGPIAIDEMAGLKSAFLSIEYQDLDGLFFIGLVDAPGYSDEYDPHVLVHQTGWIVAYYPVSSASKLVDVIARNLDQTILEKAVVAVGAAGGFTVTSVSYYDFAQPAATTMLLIAEYQADGNAFTLNIPPTNTYYEKSYAFYRYYEPSFTLDNDLIDQVNFVLTNADYFNKVVYGTIYGHFGDPDEIDFGADLTHTFTVWNRDFYAFGALAILYSGTDPIAVADADYVSAIPLVAPAGLPALTYDYTPTAPDKLSPIDDATDVVLNPVLSWNPSTAPNYEYCLDASNDVICDTGWVSTGSATTADLSNLFYDTTYYWQVRAMNSITTTEADLGTWWSFTTPATIPPGNFAKVSGVLTEPIDSLSKLTMSWQASYGAYYYEYCVDTTPQCIAPELWHNVGLATTATASDLLLDTTYYWQVRAVNYLGDTINYTYADAGTWSQVETRTFSKIRPVDLAVHYATLPLEWESTPIATSYQYCVDTTDDNLCDATWKSVGLSTSVVAKKLLAGTYYWQVRAVTAPNTYEYANDGEWWEFTILPKNVKITLFKVSPINGAVEQPMTDLLLSWKATKTAISYEYCFFDIDDTDTTPISDDDTCTYFDENWVNTSTATEATIGGLLDTTTYYWQVRANIGTQLIPVWIYADKDAYWAFTTIVPAS